MTTATLIQEVGPEVVIFPATKARQFFPHQVHNAFQTCKASVINVGEFDYITDGADLHQLKAGRNRGGKVVSWQVLVNLANTNEEVARKLELI